MTSCKESNQRESARLGDRFHAIVAGCPNMAAVGDEDHVVTFAELELMVRALVAFLPKHDDSEAVTVWLALPGGPECTAVQLAGLMSHCVIVPLAPDLTSLEAAQFASLAPPQLVIVPSLDRARALLMGLPNPVPLLCLSSASEPLGEAVDEWQVLHWTPVMQGQAAPLEPSGRFLAWPVDAAILQFTSGSTGSPKGIVLTRHNLIAYLDNQAAFLQPLAGQQVFCPVPQSHSYGGTVVLEHLLHGVGVHMANRFMPATDLSRMREQGCQGLLAPPNYLRMLAQLGALSDQHTPNLEWINIGTSAVDPSLIELLRSQRPQWRIILRYGLTETMGYIAHLNLAAGEALDHEGLVGAPISGIELRALPALGNPPAEIRVRGQSIARTCLVGLGVFEDLLDSKDEFATGDLACVDHEGQIHLRGRMSSFLKRNGFRINPFEIEALLRSLPGVLEAVILGVPDLLAGQCMVAIVECESGVQPQPEAKDLLAACRAKLSAHKVPQSCLVVAALPRTRSGKPDRPEISRLHELGTL